MASNVAGMYSATYNGNSLGITYQGFTSSHQIFKEKIQGDVAGEATLDNIYLGKDVFFETILNQYDAAGAQAAFWPYNATLGRMGLSGRCDSDIASPLVLTAVSGTKAATVGPVTLTVTLAILADGFPVELLFSARHRKVPLRMQALPSAYTTTPTGNETLFTTT